MKVYEIFVNGVSDGYMFTNSKVAEDIAWELECEGYDVEIVEKTLDFSAFSKI